MATIESAKARIAGVLSEELKDVSNKNLQKSQAESLCKKMSTELLQIMSEMEIRFNAKLEERDTKITKLEEENATQKKYILHTRLEHEKLQQYINRDTFKICGIEEPILPPNVHEDTDETVTTALQLAEITLPQESIDISHRLPLRDPAKSGLPKAIIVKVKGRNIRNKVMRKKKTLKENERFKAKHPKAFIVEHLTPLRSKVAHMLRNDDTIAKTWTIDGRLKVIKQGAATDAKPISIDSLAQLKKLGWSEERIFKLAFED